MIPNDREELEKLIRILDKQINAATERLGGLFGDIPELRRKWTHVRDIKIRARKRIATKLIIKDYE